jgi:hypothetical protein
VQAHSLTHRVIDGADHGHSEEPWRLAYTSILLNRLTEVTAGIRGSEPPPEPGAPTQHTPG